MAGMVHANDVRIAEGLRDIELPADAGAGDRDVEPHAQRRGRALAPRAGPRHPRPQRARGDGAERADGLLLPALLRAADVQQRLVVPVPPARAGGDADGDLVAHPVPRGRASRPRPPRPRRGSATTRGGRRSPRRTSRTCRGSRRACTRKGFEYMRLSEQAEGPSRTSSAPSTASSPASPTSSCSRRCSEVNVNPLERPVVDLGF